MSKLPDFVRDYIDPVTFKVGKALGRVIKNPNIITITGFFIGALTGPLLYLKFVYLAVFALIVSGVFDMLDGAVARALNKITKKGAFLDSNLDRLVEASLYLGISVYQPGLAIYSFLAFIFSIMVSYSRARVEGLTHGRRPKSIELGERGIRLLIMIIAMLLGYIFYGLLIVIVLAFETFMERLILYYRFLAFQNN